MEKALLLMMKFKTGIIIQDLEEVELEHGFLNNLR